MNRQLLNFVIWVFVVLLLLAVFTFFQSPGPRPASPPVAPQGDSQWLVSLVISWLPFFLLVGVWLLLARRMRARGVTGFGRGVALSAKTLDDPAHWSACAGEARTAAEQFTDVQSKRQMLEIARGYEYLAQRAEEKRRGSGSLS